jgi:hypothetical protein
MKIRNWGWMVLAALPGFASGQQPQQAQPPAQPPAQQQSAILSGQQAPASLGEIARRVRDQKKGQATSAHTWDNDNLPKTPNEVNVVGQPSSDENAPAAAHAADNANAPAAGEGAGAAGAAAPAQGASTNEAAKPAEDKQATEAQLSAAKDLLQSLQKDLDVLVRQYSLDQQTYYGKPNFAADKDGASKLKDESDQVEAKRQEVAVAQAKVNELQAKLPPAAGNSNSPN